MTINVKTVLFYNLFQVIRISGDILKQIIGLIYRSENNYLSKINDPLVMGPAISSPHTMNNEQVNSLIRLFLFKYQILSSHN